MGDITGIVLIIGSIVLLALRASMYKGGNPFKSSEQDMERLPQMILILLLSAVFMLVGINYTLYPIPTVMSATTTSSALTITAGNTIISIPSQNTIVSSTTQNQPVVTSWQIDLLWLVGFIYTFIVALMLVVDTFTMLHAGAENTGLGAL